MRVDCVQQRKAEVGGAKAAHRARLWWRAISRMMEPHVRATSMVGAAHLRRELQSSQDVQESNRRQAVKKCGQIVRIQGCDRQGGTLRSCRSNFKGASPQEHGVPSRQAHKAHIASAHPARTTSIKSRLASRYSAARKRFWPTCCRSRFVTIIPTSLRPCTNKLIKSVFDAISSGLRTAT